MTQPTPVRTLESHGVQDQTDEDFAVVYENCDHHMISIKTNSRKVPYVERCRDCGWIDGSSLTWWAENAIKVSIGDRAQRIAVATEADPFAFIQSRSPASDVVEDLDIEEVLLQALAAASSCWVGGIGDRPFDGARAKSIFIALSAELQRFERLLHKDLLNLAMRMNGLLGNSSPQEGYTLEERDVWFSQFRDLREAYNRYLENYFKQQEEQRCKSTSSATEPSTAS